MVRSDDVLATFSLCAWLSRVSCSATANRWRGVPSHDDPCELLIWNGLPTMTANELEPTKHARWSRCWPEHPLHS